MTCVQKNGIPEGMHIYECSLINNSFLGDSMFVQIPSLNGYEIVNNENDPIAEQPGHIKEKLYKSQLSALFRMQNMEQFSGFAFSINNHNIPKLECHNPNVNGEYLVDGMNYGIIGDQPGSGKTLIALSIVKNSNLSIYKNSRVLNSGDNNYIVQKLNNKINSDMYLNTTLILVPHSLFKQWKETITKKTSLSCMYIHNKKTLEELELNGKDMNQKEFAIKYRELIEKYDTILISSTFMRQFIARIVDVCRINTDYINPYCWKRLIIDEADSIHIPNMVHLETRFTWYITATYPKLSSWDCKTVKFRQSVCGNISRFLSIKCEKDFIEQSIKLPNYIQKTYNCNNPYKYLQDLQKQYNIFSAEVMEKINAMNFEEAIKDIGGNIKSENDIIKITTDKIQVTINNKMKEIDFVKGQDIPESNKKQRVKTLENQIIDLEDKKNGIINRISNIQIWGDMEKIMNTKDYNEFKDIVCDYYEEEFSLDDAIKKIDLILKKVKNPIENMRNRIINALKSGEKLCSICVQIYENPVILSCNHVYCAKCIFNWMKKDSKNKCCPYCKTPIDPKKLNMVSVSNHDCDKSKKDKPKEEENNELIIKSNENNHIEYISNQDKESTINKIISENPNGKYLIFSNYDGTFSKIEEILKSKGLISRTLKGSSGAVTNILNSFKKGDINVLMLNTNHKGAGLEITDTTDIIMTHVFDKELSKQVIGRAQRLGRTIPLNVHILKYDNENN